MGDNFDLASSYNAIWEHRQHHHHHHYNGSSVPYHSEFLPGFACSPEFWASSPQINGAVNTDSVRPQVLVPQR